MSTSQSSKTQQEPFQLIPTAQLREKERQVWESYPEDISLRWKEEDHNSQEYRAQIIVATKKELSQVKSHHKVYHKQGNLFYPSTVDEIKPTLGWVQTIDVPFFYQTSSSITGRFESVQLRIISAGTNPKVCPFHYTAIRFGPAYSSLSKWSDLWDRWEPTRNSMFELLPLLYSYFMDRFINTFYSFELLENYETYISKLIIEMAKSDPFPTCHILRVIGWFKVS